ncbi:Uncharacterised protein [Corynebacterium ulcerans]|nr:Uncharacterised protein [Corynebacterium ulcerans]
MTLIIARLKDIALFRKISRSLLIVTAAFSLTVASAPSAFAATVTAQCQVIKIGLGGDVVGHVYGNASTLNGAKRDANKYVPPGHYKRHCKGVSHRISGYYPKGGGGFRGGSF